MIKTLIGWVVLLLISFGLNEQFNIVLPIVVYITLVGIAYCKSEKTSIFTGEKHIVIPLILALVSWPVILFGQKSRIGKHGTSAMYKYQDGENFVSGSCSFTNEVSFEEMKLAVMDSVPEHISSEDVEIVTFG